jgi:hypothetical protein
MAKWFRSEPMEYISIIMNEDASHDCLADLGKLGAIQFTDVRMLLFFEGRDLNLEMLMYDVLRCRRRRHRCVELMIHGS